MTATFFDLSAELALGNTRENRDRLTHWVGCDPRRLATLMQLYLKGDRRGAQLAAGVVTLVADAHPDMMGPWLGPMVTRMQERGVHNAVVRTAMHVLQVVTVPRRLAGRVAKVCFDALEDISQPIAVRVFAMTVLVNLCREETDLAREVELAITMVLPYGTAAFTSRARHELVRLRRMTRKGPSSQRSLPRRDSRVGSSAFTRRKD